jgi:hypothetical protein
LSSIYPYKSVTLTIAQSSKHEFDEIFLGLAVYGYAKLRVLEFAYDFLHKYLDPSDYEWIQTDTDSVYLALSKENLEDCIKPELKDEYESRKSEWFVCLPDGSDKRTPGEMTIAKWRVSMMPF